MSEGKITTEKRGHLLLMGIDRREKRNSFTWHMLVDLANAYAQLESDEDARVGVLFAHGDHFTAGLDLANVAPHIAQENSLSPEGAIDPWGVHGRARTKPVVVAVQGRCLTLGIELVLAQDITIAADDTKFAQIEIKRGIFPFGGATLRWPMVSGWGNAMRWLLTGDELGAAEAYRIGLVQEVVPVGQQLDRAIAIAETIAKQAPLGVQATILSSRKAVEESFRVAAGALAPEIRRLMGTQDAQEGLASFIERREAKFTGR